MKNYYAPDENGFFGEHGGLYVSETLIPALQELAEAYHYISTIQREEFDNQILCIVK